jgi:hypothetical protein
MAINAPAKAASGVLRAVARSRPIPASAFVRHGTRGLWAGAAVLLLGSGVDLIVLWGLQFQANLQWEFVAIVNTLEAYTRLVLGASLIFAALVIGASTSIWRYRAASLLLLLLGLAAGAMGLLLLTDYFPLSQIAEGQPGAPGALTVTAAKGLMLSAVYTCVLVPLGILGLRKPGAV